MAAVVSTMLARLRLDKRQFDAGIRDAADGGNRLSSTLKSIAKTAAFGALAAGAASTAAAIGKTVGAALRYEKQMANVNTLLRLNDTDQRALNQRLLEFTAGTTSRLTDVSNAYYDIASGIADTSKHMAVLTAAENAATAGFADLKATTSALVGVMNAYNLEASEADNISDILINTVRNGVLTMDELAGVLPQVSGLAAATGVSMADLAGAIGGITKTGVQASEAGTQLKALMTQMIKPSSELQKVIEQLGYASGEALLADKGLMGAVTAIREETGDSFTQMFSNVRALTGALNLTAPAAQEAHTAIQDYTGAVDDAIAATGNTLALDAMRSKLDVISVGLGGILTPALRGAVDKGINPFLDGVIGLLGYFGALPTEGAKFTDTLDKINRAALATSDFIKSMASGVGRALGDLFRGDIGAEEFFEQIRMVSSAAVSAARGVVSDFVDWLQGTAFGQRIINSQLLTSIRDIAQAALEGAQSRIDALSAGIAQAFGSTTNLPVIDKLLELRNVEFSAVLQSARSFIDVALDNLSLDLAATRERIASALRAFVGGITFPALPALDLSGVQAEVAGKLKTLLDLTLPDLDPLSLDLDAIRNEAASKLQSLANLTLPDLPALSLDLSGIRAQAASKLRALLDLTIADLSPLSLDLTAIRNEAASKLRALLDLTLPDLAPLSLDLASIRAEAASKLQALQAVTLPALAPLSFDLAAIRDQAASKLQALNLTLPDLAPLSFDLAAFRDEAASKLEALLVTLPDLAPLSFDLTAIRNEAAGKLQALLNLNLPDLAPLSFDLMPVYASAQGQLSALQDVAVPDLPALSFDLSTIRGAAQAQLSALQGITLPSLSPLSFDLTVVRNAAQAQLASALSSAKSAVENTTLTIPPSGLQIDMQTVVNVAIKGIALLIGGPQGLIAALIVKAADDVVKQATGTSLGDHVRSAARAIQAALGIDFKAVGNWILGGLRSIFGFVNSEPPVDTAPVQASMQAGIGAIEGKSLSAINDIAEAVRATGAADGALVGAELRTVLGNAASKISAFLAQSTAAIQQIDFASIGADVGQWLRTAIAGITTWIRDALGALFAADTGVDVTESIAQLTTGVINWIGTAISGMVRFIGGFVGSLFGDDKELIDTEPHNVAIIEIGNSLLSGLITVGKGVVQGALQSSVFKDVASWAQRIKAQATAMLEGLAKLPETIVESVASSAVFTSLGQWITSILDNARNLLEGLTGLPAAIVKSVLTGSLFTSLAEWINKILDTARRLLEGLVKLPASIARSVITNGLFTSLWTWVSSILGDTRKLLEGLVAIPRNIVHSVTGGNLFTNLTQWIGNINQRVKVFLEGFVNLPRRITDQVLNSPFFWNIWVWVQSIVSSARKLVTRTVKAIVDWIRDAIRQVIPNNITILGRTLVSDIHRSLGLRERGGPVEAGELYRVNEQGTEYFKPHTDGQVIPLGDPRVFGGQVGGGDTYNISVYANSRAQGESAARGFEMEMLRLQRARG